MLYRTRIVQLGAVAALVAACALLLPSGRVSAAEPPNFDFTLGEPVVSGPANFGFESGLSGWTVTEQESGTSAGTTSGVSGSALLISGNANMKPRVTSSPFTIQSDGPIFSFYYNTLGNGSAFYSASVATFPCVSYNQFSGAGSSTADWRRVDVDFSAYVGQTVCIQFRAYQGVAFDEPATYKIPNWTVNNGTPRMSTPIVTAVTDAPTGNYNLSETTCLGEVHPRTVGPAAQLFGSSKITSEAFPIPASATDLRFLLKGVGSGAAATIHLLLASEGYAVQHTIYNKIIGDKSVLTSCDITEWAGETVKIAISSSFGGTVLVAVGGTTDAIDRPLLEDQAIMLLHGWRSDCGSMVYLEAQLTAVLELPPENVRCFKYPGQEGYPSQGGVAPPQAMLAWQIWMMKKELNLPDDVGVHIVGHSQGGLLGRYYTEKTRTNLPFFDVPVASLTMLGTPNEGNAVLNNTVTWSRTVCRFFPAEPLCVMIKALDFATNTQSRRDLAAGSPLLDYLNNGFTVPSGVAYKLQYGLNGGGWSPLHPRVSGDCVVSKDSALGRNDVFAPGVQHGSLSHTASTFICANDTLTNSLSAANAAVATILGAAGGAGGMEGQAAALPAPSPVELPVLTKADGLVNQGEQDVHNLTVPAGVTGATFALYYTALPSIGQPQLDLQVRRPDSSIVQPTDSDVVATSSITTGDAFDVLTESVLLSAPAAGTWEITVTGTSTPADMPYAIAIIPDSQVGLALEPATALVTQGAPVVVTAALFDGTSPIAASSLSADVVTGDNNLTSLSLLDDGVAPDKVAGDFVYTGTVSSTSSCGIYAVNATASGTSGSEGAVTRLQAASFEVHLPGSVIGNPCDADEDDDTLTDDEELNGKASPKVTLGTMYSDPFTVDTDLDGCPDGRELGSSQMTGGRRNPANPWDYFNPTGDGLNRIDDILAVVGQYFDDDDDANPGLPPYEPGYDPDTDRTGQGLNDWNTGLGDGLQRIDDILAQIKQYFHDC